MTALVTFTINGHTYTNNPGNTEVPEGYRFIGYGWVPALANLVVDIVAVAGQALSHAGAAADSAAAAAGSVGVAAAAAATAVSAPGTSATSGTSMTLGVGAHEITIQTGKLLRPGNFITVAHTLNPSAHNQWGVVDSYDSGTGVLVFIVPDVDAVTGSGTYSDWTISLSGARGATGQAGASGMVAWVLINSNTTITQAPAAVLVDTSAGNVDITMGDGLPDLSDITIRDVARAFVAHRCRIYPGAGRTVMGDTFLDLTISSIGDYRGVLHGLDWRF